MTPLRAKFRWSAGENYCSRILQAVNPPTALANANMQAGPAIVRLAIERNLDALRSATGGEGHWFHKGNRFIDRSAAGQTATGSGRRYSSQPRSVHVPTRRATLPACGLCRAAAASLGKSDMAWFVEHAFAKSEDAADPRINLVDRDDLSDLPPATVITAQSCSRKALLAARN